VGPVTHYDEMVQLAQDEGMPPKLFCQIFDWLPAYYSRRRTNRIRSLQAA
jgi:hypothetical protein